MWQNQKVCVVFPAFNEEVNIKKAIEDFFKISFIDEIIVVDNNSTDNTKQEILTTSAKYVFEEEKGYGSALIRGFKETDADLIISSEPDGTFKSTDILKLLVYSNDYEVVYGTRTSKNCISHGAYMNWFLRYGNLVVAKFLEYLFKGPSLTDVGCTFKLIRKNTLKKFINHLKVKGSHFQPEFIINSILTTKRIVEIPVDYLPRKGESKITGNFWRSIKLGCVMIFYILFRWLSSNLNLTNINNHKN